MDGKGAKPVKRTGAAGPLGVGEPRSRSPRATSRGPVEPGRGGSYNPENPGARARVVIWRAPRTPSGELRVRTRRSKTCRFSAARSERSARGGVGTSSARTRTSGARDRAGDPGTTVRRAGACSAAWPARAARRRRPGRRPRTTDRRSGACSAVWPARAVRCRSPTRPRSRCSRSRPGDHVPFVDDGPSRDTLMTGLDRAQRDRAQHDRRAGRPRGARRRQFPDRARDPHLDHLPPAARDLHAHDAAHQARVQGRPLRAAGSAAEGRHADPAHLLGGPRPGAAQPEAFAALGRGPAGGRRRQVEAEGRHAVRAAVQRRGGPGARTQGARAFPAATCPPARARRPRRSGAPRRRRARRTRSRRTFRRRRGRRRPGRARSASWPISTARSRRPRGARWAAKAGPRRPIRTAATSTTGRCRSTRPGTTGAPTPPR